MKFDLSNIELSYNDIRKNLTLPIKPSKELAEFIGILIGDGYIGYYEKYNNHILEISGHSELDLNYLNIYVRDLIKNLFNINSSYTSRKDQNASRVRVCSKGLVQYLEQINFVKGKKEQIRIPYWIISDRELMIHFLKGIVDTDCSVHFRKKYPIINFTSKSKPLIATISDFIKKEGFIVGKFYKEERINKQRDNSSTVYRIFLNGHKNFNLWMNLINFRNEKHLKKIKVGQTGFEPVI